MKSGSKKTARGVRQWLKRLWATITFKNRYRPELHYMRGHPPKHTNGAGAKET